MNRTPKVSVIIPTYNRATMLCECIDAVFASDYPAIEVVVVDDCSPDNTATTLTSHFGTDPRLHYLRNDHNMFQAVARNRGTAIATGEYFLFLDDDNLIAPDMITRLVECFHSHPAAGLIAPMAIHQTSTRQGIIWTLGSDFNRWTSQPNDTLANLPEQELDAKTGSTDCFPTTYSPNAFMVPQAVFAEVNGFDETYVVTFEESDFGWRILEREYEAYILKTARTTHRGFLEPGCVPQLRQLGIERPKRTYYFARNRLRFVKRHFTWQGKLSVMFIFAPLSVGYYALVALKHCRLDIALAYLRGTLVGLFT